MMLIAISVLEEDVQHGLRLRHSTSQVKIRKQCPDHLQTADTAVAPIFHART